MVDKLETKGLMEDTYGRFSIDLSRDLAASLLKNAGGIGLEKEHDLVVIIDTLIHLLGEGKVQLKN